MKRHRKGAAVSFLATVAKAKSYLQEHRRVSLRGLKRDFELDDDLRMGYTAQGHSVGLAQRMESFGS